MYTVYCHAYEDSTRIEIDLTPEELAGVLKVANKINEAADGEWQPTIVVVQGKELTNREAMED